MFENLFSVQFLSYLSFFLPFLDLLKVPTEVLKKSYKLLKRGPVTFLPSPPPPLPTPQLIAVISLLQAWNKKKAHELLHASLIFGCSSVKRKTRTCTLC